MRKATTQDIPQILEMLIHCYLETHKLHFQPDSFDYFKAKSWLETILAAPQVLAYTNGDGIIIAAQSECWWGEGKFVQGIVFYVRPKARNGYIARKLFRAVEEDARGLGAKWLLFTPTYKEHTTVIPGLMNWAGFTQVGGVHAKILD